MNNTAIVRCPTCGKDKDRNEKWDEETCQLCWEAHCSREWWKMVNSLTGVVA